MNDLLPTDDTTIDVNERITAQHGHLPAIHYLGRTLTWSELDDEVRRVATGLRRLGVGPGERVMLLMQNVPHYPILLLSLWRLGAIAVPVNPMLTPKEIGFVIDDAHVCAVVAQRDLLDRVAHSGRADVTTIAVDPTDFAGSWPSQLAVPLATEPSGAMPFAELRANDRSEEASRATADAPAVLTYTSGTTGPPKGAINTHRNVLFASQFYERWVVIDRRDSILGMAPLFHITGLIAHMGPSFVTGAPLVLGYRFDPEVIFELVERYRPTFTIGAITAFIALMDHPSLPEHDLSSLKKIYSGGAPIAPTIVNDFERAIGPYIHNIYGLTEATGPCLAVPLGERAPIDPSTGALAAGKPVINTRVRLLREDGAEAADGEPGEVVMSGPQVIPGYWNREDETAQTIRDGWLHTGDVAVRDTAGWYFIIDRIKDQINASGFKVWPREVEDVLVSHPAVLTAAVVGVPDDYRGETVKGFVVLRRGQEATSNELIDFCRERLAAYKYPRQIDIVADLPRNAAGKILRRQLRSM